MANWKKTYKASTVVALDRDSDGGWSGDTGDPHPPVGNDEDAHHIARAEFHFTVSDWPSMGHLVGAWLTLHKSPTSYHDGYHGSSSRAELFRITETPNRESPSSVDSDSMEFNVGHDVTVGVATMVEESLPATLKRRDNETAGGNAQTKLWFALRSSDEDAPSRSFVIKDDIYLTIEIKTAVTPDPPGIVEVVGAVEGSGGPTIVGSTDGQTLAVKFAFRGAAGDYPTKAELALYGVGATDETPGTAVATTGSITPSAGGGPGVYLIRLTGLTLGTTGRFRIRTTSQKGEQGDWSSLDDQESHILLATIPGPPLDIVFQPYTDDPHILFSLNSPDPDDYLTGGEVEATLVPQGTRGWFSGMEDDGGAGVRRADLTWGGTELADGQRISYRVRTRNAAGVTGSWSAPREVTVHAIVTDAPTVTPEPGRLLTLRPTFTIANDLFDKYQLRLLDPVDDDRVLYDTGAVTVVNQTSVAVQVPAGKLAYGQKFRVVASTAPDGSTTLGPENTPQAYSIASLPRTVLSVPAAVNGKVQTQYPVWHREDIDPDGGTITTRILEVDVASTPQGDGTRITKRVASPGTPDSTISAASLTIPWETSVDARAWAKNDITTLATTTAVSGGGAGSTALTVASTSGMSVGQRFLIYSATAGHTEERAIATLPGANVVTFLAPFEWSHAVAEVVSVYVPGIFSPWVTITALQPPTVDLISPADGATVADPTDTFDWSVTGYGGRAQASADLTIYLADGSVLATVAVTTDTEAQVPAFLLDTATDYLWDVTVTDTEGMATTSAQYAFTTDFAEPVPVLAVTAVADTEGGVVGVSWDDSLEPYLNHYEVTWYADDGKPVRIDGGPETLLDGNEPFTGTSLAHIGARLGTNVYTVAVSNGWRSSEPVSANVDLVRNDGRAWALVDPAGTAYGLIATSASIPHAGTIERYQAPGGRPRQVTWGGEARRLPMTIETIPSEDREMVSVLRTWMQTGSPVWVKGAAPYLLDPLWATLQDFTPTPESWGGMSIDLDWLELGDPTHAILPEVVEEPEGEGDIYSTVDAIDLGTLEET